MKKPFKKAIAPLAVTCALFATTVSAAPQMQYDANGEPIVDFEALRASVAQQKMAFGLIVKKPGVQANTASMKAMADVNSIDKLSASIGEKVQHKRFMFNGSQVLNFENGMKPVAELERMAAKLRAQGYEVSIDHMMHPLLTPNDTHYGVQWHYSDPTGGINAPAAWDLANGSGVNVAVLDTGYRPHTDLVANIVGGYDFVSNSSNARDGNGRDSDARDEGDWVATANECYSGSRTSDSSWHGTHVAGTIAAVTNNNKGVAGVAYGAKVVPLRVLAKCGGSTSDIADAIVWAAGGSVSGVPANPNPAKVINMSLGGQSRCQSVTQNAINSARANGAVVVVAAGNSNSDASGFTPASCDGVINVAATDRSGNRSSYSNYGSTIDVAAPGGMGGSDGVASTMNSGTTTPSTDNYSYSAGTSMAAPHVAGVAALMFSVNPNLTPSQVESILKSSARSFPSGSTCSTSNCGAGIIDARAAVVAAQGGGGGGGGGSDTALTKGVAKTSLSGARGSEQFFTIDVPAGASNLTFTMSGGSGDADLYTRKGSKPTTSSYDCRPYKSGNNENCSVASPSVDTYHVMIRGYSAYSGVSLVADYTTSGGGGGGNGTDSVTNNTNYTISDYSTVSSPVTVSGRSSIGSIDVTIDIKHTYIGDLVVKLLTPDGKSATLSDRSGGSTDNIQKTYSFDASSVANGGNGVWKLQVEDKGRGDTGYIDSWTLKFK